MGFSRVQPRAGTAAEWTAHDDILRAGEVGYETDTGLRKYGDGSTPWSGLDYALDAASADAAVAALVSDPATATGGSLNARFGRKRSFDVRDYGAKGDGVADDTTAIQAAATAAAGSVLVFPKGIFRIIGSTVTVPAGTVVVLDEATIRVYTQGSLKLSTLCRLWGGTFENTSLTGFVGGERFVTYAGSGIQVVGSTFAGQGYRHGIVIETVGAGSCDNGLVRDCAFTSTAYGVLHNGGGTANTCTANGFRVLNNTFTGTRRGDAVEFNVSLSSGLLIAGNRIDDVQDNGFAATGMGIGLAGAGPYANPPANPIVRAVVSNNIVTNCTYEGIHVEVGIGVLIANNHVENSGTLAGVGNGIELYGSQFCTVVGNNVTGFANGIGDSLGLNAGAYVVSSSGNRIQDNRVRSCGVGIATEATGTDVTSCIKSNVVGSCTTGISQTGAATVFHDSNTVVNCTTGFAVDANPAAKAAIVPAVRQIVFTNNQTFNTNQSAVVNTFTNLTGTVRSGSGNSFTLP